MVNKDVENILTSYAQLKLHGSPLKSVNLNSPTKRSPRTSLHGGKPLPTAATLQIAETPEEVYKLCINAIDLALRRFSSIKSLSSAHLRLASTCFVQLYKTNLPSKRNEVSKRHQQLILKLIELEGALQSDYSVTMKELRCAVSRGASSAGVETSVLEYDTGTPTTLTFFALQTIFKMFQAGNFERADDLIQLFLNDTRFTRSLTDAHKNMLIKLVLSITRISPSPQFKQCMNVKFLEYLTTFNLKFGDYIANITRETFISDIENAALSLKNLDYLPFFIFNFLKADTSESFSSLVEHIQLLSSPQYESIEWKAVIPDTAASLAVIKLMGMSNLNTDLVRNELQLVRKPSRELMKALCTYIAKTNKQRRADEVLLMYFLDHTTRLDKFGNAAVDHVVLYISSAKYDNEFLEKVLYRLQCIYVSSNELKRLRNLSNLAFNLRLYCLSLSMEKVLFKKNQKSSDLGFKFKKSLHHTQGNQRIHDELVSQIFNNEFLNSLGDSKLLERLEEVDQKFGSKLVFTNCKRLVSTDLTEENRALLFVLATKYCSDDLSSLYSQLEINEPILQMLCAVHYHDLPVVKITRPSTMSITNTDPLIKSFYYVTLEKKSKSTMNIKKILSLYTNSWVPRNRFSVTKFEIEFLKTFVDYLKFVGFHKSIKQLVDAVEIYRSRCDDAFGDWLTFEQTENAVSLKLVLKLPPSIFDDLAQEKDFESSTDSLLRSLSYNLLKLKYYLVNFDQERLVEVAEAIDLSVKANPDVFSTDNKNRYKRDKFLDVLLLLLNLHHSRAKLMWAKGHHLESIVSAVCCIQLAKSILKNDTANLQVLNKMGSSFRTLINTLIHLGITKDADYYIAEFSKFNDSTQQYKTLFAQNCYFITHYYHACGRQAECEELKSKADEVFEELNLIGDETTEELFVDNYSLIYYRLLSDIYINDEQSQLDARTNLKSFLTFVEKDGKLLASTWKLYYEYHFNSETIDLMLNKSQNPYLVAMNFMLNSRRLFINAQNSLNMDPLYSTLEDSAMVIPATVVRENQGPPSPAPTSNKSKPKSLKNVKKAIMGMRQSKGMILDLFPDLHYLANYQRNELHRVLSLDLLTLSSISNKHGNESVSECLLLNNHVKGQPFENEKYMVEVTKKGSALLPDFGLNMLSPTVKFDKPDMELIRAKNWQVISIDVSTINDELIISRLDESPKMLKLPLTRLCVRTGEEANFKLADCLQELAAIIKESDITLSTETTSSVDSPEDRKKWHETRAEIDERLCTLLARIEHYWIGGFASIFNPLRVKQEDLDNFKRRFLNIIRLNIPSRSQKPHTHAQKPVEIDDFIVELFLKLGDPSKLTSTEPMEDLIYFVLDILLFHGEENAYDEVDIDNIYVQVEMLLNDFLAANPEPMHYSHTVLLLGKELIDIPWESLPCLRELSISRVPSLNMLVQMLKTHETMTVSKKKGAIVVNPGGDLKKTEERFTEPLKHLTGDLEWDAVVGVKPTEEKFKESLQSNVFVYVGHGAGTSYIREMTIKDMDSICPTLLLGCSSAALRSNNQLEPNGTIYSYLLGGCPMIVGNLWDVTDKDIDKFSFSLFQKWGLGSEDEGSMDICEAVKRSRDECKLKYLNGAAPVVYGLPLTLS